MHERILNPYLLYKASLNDPFSILMNSAFKESQPSHPPRVYPSRKIQKETAVWSPLGQTEHPSSALRPAECVIKRRAVGVSTQNTLSSVQKTLFADPIPTLGTHVITNEDPTPDDFVLVVDDNDVASIQDLDAIHLADIDTDFVVVEYE